MSFRNDARRSRRLRAVATLAAGVGLVAGGCLDRQEAEPLPAPTPRVERFDGALLVRWDQAPQAATVQVFAGSTDAAIDRAHPVATLVGGEARIELDPERPRPIFEVASSDGRRWIVAERQLPLEGQVNFRDLGGYQTTDGRTTRWGRLYRSGELSGLSDSDVAFLSRLGIRLVCDFRGPAELEEDPDRLPTDDPPVVLNLPIFDGRVDALALRDRILSGDTEGFDFAELLVDGNREFVESASDRYASMFERIAAPGGLPALVHCTAGKDRAGFASEVLLLALGVPETTVFDDYLLTNHYTADQTERALFGIRLLSLFRTDSALVRPLFEARREYLEAAMDAIRARHGDFASYLRDGLGVSDATLARLQDELLTAGSTAASRMRSATR